MSHHESIVGDTLFSAETIAQKTAEIGGAITEDYRGKELVIVGVLKGAAVFASDLIRHVDLPLKLDYSELITYGDRTSPRSEVVLAKDVRKNIRGQHVLVVEDIVDTGLTISFLAEHLRIRQPASLEICTLLYKPSRLRVDVPLKYVCFEIGDCFAVGYGLDYAGLYRNLPYIAKIRDEVYSTMDDIDSREYGIRF
ncbi:MAG: hypoxanthine phosphoribosyltransferase [bacterium]|nr:hypoxanthine phosphoribosyltransferase [bacterium]